MQNAGHIYLTLVRGFAGKGNYQKILKHLQLTIKDTTVRVPNTFEYRAAARKVQHLLRVETSEQFNARMRKFAEDTRVLNPIHAHHVPQAAHKA